VIADEDNVVRQRSTVLRRSRCALKNEEPLNAVKSGPPSAVNGPPSTEETAVRLRAENPFYAVKSQNPGHAFNALFHSLSKKRERLTQNRSRILELIFPFGERRTVNV